MDKKRIASINSHTTAVIEPSASQFVDNTYNPSNYSPTSQINVINKRTDQQSVHIVDQLDDDIYDLPTNHVLTIEKPLSKSSSSASITSQSPLQFQSESLIINSIPDSMHSAPNRASNVGINTVKPNTPLPMPPTRFSLTSGAFSSQSQSSVSPTASLVPPTPPKQRVMDVVWLLESLRVAATDREEKLLAFREIKRLAKCEGDNYWQQNSAQVCIIM